jgi:predicted DNA-binding transcriptional regulator AlpA
MPANTIPFVNLLTNGTSMTTAQDKILHFRHIQEITGRSRTTIWRWEKAGQFPKRVQLGPHGIGWRASEIQAWIDQLPRRAA